MTDEALLPTCVELTTLRLLRGPSDADRCITGYDLALRPGASAA